MRRNNSYKDLIESIDFLKSSESFISQKERELVKSLEEIVQIDRTTSVINNLFGGKNEFTDLISKIAVAYTETDSNEAKEKLLKLNENIRYYVDTQLLDNDYDIKRLIMACLPTLKLDNYSEPLFFGKKLVEEKDGKYVLNRNIIDKVYGILDDTDLIEDIRIGANYNNKEDALIGVVNSCKEALKYKDAVYKGADLIVQYNIITKEIYDINKKLKTTQYMELDNRLNDVIRELDTLSYSRIKSFFCTKKIEELKAEYKKLDKLYEDKKYIEKVKRKQSDRLEKITERLKEEGLLNLVLGKEEDGVKKSNLHSLARKLSTVISYSSFNEYYDYIEQELKRANKELNITRKERREFLNKTNSKAYNLLANHSDTCNNIMEFTKRGTLDITPSIALCILKGLVDLEKSSFEDKGITYEEMLAVINYYKEITENNLEEFNCEFLEIMHDAKHKTHKK